MIIVEISEWLEWNDEYIRSVYVGSLLVYIWSKWYNSGPGWLCESDTQSAPALSREGCETGCRSPCAHRLHPGSSPSHNMKPLSPRCDQTLAMEASTKYLSQTRGLESINPALTCRTSLSNRLYMAISHLMLHGKHSFRKGALIHPLLFLVALGFTSG
jgi:hypothetical protein